MSLSYNQIIKLNREYSEATYFIKNFGNGHVYDILDKNQEPTFKYPLMFMEDLSMPIQDKVEVFGFRVYFMSRVAEMESRNNDLIESAYNDAKSDMLQLAKDYIAFWAQDTTYPEFDIVETSNRETFKEETEDRLAGCFIDVQFRQAFKYSACNLPMDGITPPPSVVCSPASYQNSNGSFTQSINSGSGFTAPDVTITVNGIPFVIPANEDAVINVDAPINTSNIYKTGAFAFKPGDDGNNPRGRGVDFYNLNFTNPFGNIKAYTGITGGSYNESLSQYEDVNGNVTTEALAFPNTLILNWKSYDQISKDVLCMNYTKDNSLAPNTMMANAPYTFGGFAGFYVANDDELDSYVIENGVAMNWPPINFGIGTGGVIDRVHTSTSVSTVSNVVYINNWSRNQATGTGSGTVFYVRYLNTVTDLGL